MWGRLLPASVRQKESLGGVKGGLFKGQPLSLPQERNIPEKDKPAPPLTGRADFSYNWQSKAVLAAPLYGNTEVTTRQNHQ